MQRSNHHPTTEDVCALNPSIARHDPFSVSHASGQRARLGIYIYVGYIDVDVFMPVCVYIYIYMVPPPKPRFYHFSQDLSKKYKKRLRHRFWRGGSIYMYIDKREPKCFVLCTYMCTHVTVCCVVLVTLQGF